MQQLIEARIVQAQARGEFDNLPGAGRPLVLDYDPLVPEEVRVANRVMKNAGVVPTGVIELNALAALRRALEQGDSNVPDDDPADPSACSGQAAGERDRAERRRRIQARLLAVRIALQSRGLRQLSR